MEIIEIMKARHAVRHFDGQPIKQEHQNFLNNLINKINKEQNLHIQLIVNEPKAFDGGKAKMTNFTGCVNYLAFVGPKSKDLNEKIGFWGEEVILKAQELGINSCWVYLTFNKQKDAYKVLENEKLVLVAALGYGTTQGHSHKSKTYEKVTKVKGEAPEWFKKGVEAALLAPTGVNRQGFKISLLDKNQVKICNCSLCGDIDLGIVKYHFEKGAGKDNFSWSE